MSSACFIVLVFVLVANPQSLLAAPVKDSSAVCTQQPRDLFLVVDGSASVGPKNFRKVKKFLGDLISSVHIGRELTHVGLLQFSQEEKINIELNLDSSYETSTLLKKINALTYQSGVRTRTDLALKKVEEEIFTKTGGDRPNVPDVLVVFTDGKSRERQLTIKHAQRLKDKRVRIIAIGVGQELQGRRSKELINELKAIASTHKDVKMVDSFDRLDEILLDIVNHVCKIITTTPPPTTTTTTAATTTTTTTTTAEPTRRMRAPAPTLAHSLKTTRRPEPTRPRSLCDISHPKDILFVVDGTANYQFSYSQAWRRFEKVKGFIKSVIRGLNSDKFRVGVIQYSGKDVTMDVDFMSGAYKRELLLRVELMAQKRGYKKYAADALVKANTKFYELDALSDRHLYPNVIVFLSRGRPVDLKHTLSEAKFLRLRDIRIISVGFGSSTRILKPILNKISSPESTFLAKEKHLKKHRQAILDSICTMAPQPAMDPMGAYCHRTPHDIFFVVDGSASIKWYNFKKLKTFLMDLISLLKIEHSNINTGLIQFSEAKVTSIIWDLGRHSFIETLGYIQQMKYQAGKRTDTGDALTRVNNEIFNGLAGDRPGVRDMVIIFTDGNAHDLSVARKQAKRLKEKGVIVVTIGAGTRSSLRRFKHELIEMASSPEYAMTVDFNDLDRFAAKAFPLVCNYLRRRL